MLTDSNLSLITGVLAALGALVTLWHFRKKRIEENLEASRALYGLCEQVIKTASPAELAAKLTETLPAIIRGTSIQLFTFNRPAKLLERVATAEYPEAVIVPTDESPETAQHAAGVCYQTRGPVSVPDARRSPVVRISVSANQPRAAFLAPLLSRDEVLGVLEIDNFDQVGYFSAEDQLAVQHLANQVAAALRLQQQQAIREQLFQGEKMAAAGQLISGVAEELHDHLENLARLADTLAGSGAASFDAEGVMVAQPVHSNSSENSAAALSLASEAKRASEIIHRLASFSHPRSTAPARMDLTAIVSEAARFREPEWKAHGLDVQTRLSSDPAIVLGVEPQLSQVVMTLLVYAQQQGMRARSKEFSVQTNLLANRVLLEVGVPEPEVDPADDMPLRPKSGADAEPLDGMDATSWDVCKTIVHQHDGEIRCHRRNGSLHIEIDLPAHVETVSTPAPSPASGGTLTTASKQLTLMVIDVDATSARNLTALLGKPGHRVVPVPAEEALDLAQRLRFDAVFWAVRHARGGLAEFRDRLADAVGCVVLISDAADPELARSIEQSGGFLLSRPVQEAALDRILTEIGAHSR